MKPEPQDVVYLENELGSKSSLTFKQILEPLVLDDEPTGYPLIQFSLLITH